MNSKQKIISKDFLNSINNYIYNYCGIKITGAHKNYMYRFLASYLKENNLSEEQYIQKIKQSKKERNTLIDKATINETYFFREAKQFELLQNIVFPNFATQEKNIKIWSAACATGEEALSLAVLAKKCNLQADIWATDVDISALSILESGNYSQSSFRKDGSQFHQLLKEYGTFSQDPYYNTKIYAPQKNIRDTIHIMEFNLNTATSLPIELSNADIIFLRNVFIYFDTDKRTKILKTISNNMKDNSFLFLSISEMASMDTKDLNQNLIKTKQNNVYYFVKQNNRLPKKNLRSNKKLQKNYSQKISHPIHTEKKDLHCVYKDCKTTFKQILFELDNNNNEKAINIIDTFPEPINKQDIVAYMHGYVAFECGNSEIAKKYFIKSELINPSIWPAFFLHAQIVKQENFLESRQLFIKCAEILEIYIKNKQTEYDFLLESFSSTYYYKLCCQYLKGSQQ